MKHVHKWYTLHKKFIMKHVHKWYTPHTFLKRGSSKLLHSLLFSKIIKHCKYYKNKINIWQKLSRWLLHTSTFCYYQNTKTSNNLLQTMTTPTMREMSSATTWELWWSHTTIPDKTKPQVSTWAEVHRWRAAQLRSALGRLCHPQR